MARAMIRTVSAMAGTMTATVVRAVAAMAGTMTAAVMRAVSAVAVTMTATVAGVTVIACHRAGGGEDGKASGNCQDRDELFHRVFRFVC
jgi:hypothetical protein